MRELLDDPRLYPYSRCTWTLERPHHCQPGGMLSVSILSLYLLFLFCSFYIMLCVYDPEHVSSTWPRFKPLLSLLLLVLFENVLKTHQRRRCNRL